MYSSSTSQKNSFPLNPQNQAIQEVSSPSDPLTSDSSLSVSESSPAQNKPSPAMPSYQVGQRPGVTKIYEKDDELRESKPAKPLTKSYTDRELRWVDHPPKGVDMEKYSRGTDRTLVDRNSIGIEIPYAFLVLLVYATVRKGHGNTAKRGWKTKSGKQ